MPCVPARLAACSCGSLRKVAPALRAPVLVTLRTIRSAHLRRAPIIPTRCALSTRVHRVTAGPDRTLLYALRACTCAYPNQYPQGEGSRSSRRNQHQRKYTNGCRSSCCGLLSARDSVRRIALLAMPRQPSPTHKHHEPCWRLPFGGTQS